MDLHSALVAICKNLKNFWENRNKLWVQMLLHDYLESLNSEFLKTWAFPIFASFLCAYSARSAVGVGEFLGCDRLLPTLAVGNIMDYFSYLHAVKQ